MTFADSMTTTDATNLTALGILAVIVVWSVTKGIPMLRDFLNDQRSEFTNALERRDDQSERMATAHHEASAEIARSLRDLAREVRDQPAKPPPATTGAP